jgi:hypothetical protein
MLFQVFPSLWLSWQLVTMDSDLRRFAEQLFWCCRVDTGRERRQIGAKLGWLSTPLALDDKLL